MKKVKALFTIIRMQTLSEANLGPWRLEFTKQVSIT